MTSKKSEMNGANSLTLHETVGHVGVVTMNNSKRLNALGSELVQGILDSLDRFDAPEIRAVILRALPSAKVWSAEHNIKEIPLDGQDPITWSEKYSQNTGYPRSGEYRLPANQTD